MHLLPKSGRYLAAALSVALAGPAFAVVNFNDGGTHTIPIDTADINDINGGAAANVTNATTLNLLVGGTISSIDTNNTNNGATGVQVRDTSIFNYSGGTLSATDTMNGQNAIGIQGFGNAIINYSADGTGFSAMDQDANGSGIGIQVREMTQLNILAGSTLQNISDVGGGSALGIQVTTNGSNPTITIDGIISGVVDNGGGSAQGVSIGDNKSANLSISATGSITVTDNGGSDAIGINAAGANNASVINFLGAIVSNDNNAGNAIGIRAAGVSSLVAGGSITVNDTGNGSAIGIQTQNNATADVSAMITVTESGGAHARVLQANNDSVINVLSGFKFSMTEANGGNARLLLANGSSVVNIFGGDLIGDEIIQIDADAKVFIWNTDDVFVDGEAYSDVLTAGPNRTISGTLSDGSAFSFIADINGNGMLAVVPEPTTTLLGLVGIAALGIRRRRLA